MAQSVPVLKMNKHFVGLLVEAAMGWEACWDEDHVRGDSHIRHEYLMTSNLGLFTRCGVFYRFIKGIQMAYLRLSHNFRANDKLISFNVLVSGTIRYSDAASPASDILGRRSLALELIA